MQSFHLPICLSSIQLLTPSPNTILEKVTVSPNGDYLFILYSVPNQFSLYALSIGSTGIQATLLHCIPLPEHMQYTFQGWSETGEKFALKQLGLFGMGQVAIWDINDLINFNKEDQQTNFFPTDCIGFHPGTDRLSLWDSACRGFQVRELGSPSQYTPLFSLDIPLHFSSERNFIIGTISNSKQTAALVYDTRVGAKLGKTDVVGKIKDVAICSENPLVFLVVLQDKTLVYSRNFSHPMATVEPMKIFEVYGDYVLAFSEGILKVWNWTSLDEEYRWPRSEPYGLCAGFCKEGTMAYVYDKHKPLLAFYALEKWTKQNLLLLLCCRSFLSTSVWSKDYLPLDLFKVLLSYSRLWFDPRVKRIQLK